MLTITFDKTKIRQVIPWGYYEKSAQKYRLPVEFFSIPLGDCAGMLFFFFPCYNQP